MENTVKGLESALRVQSVEHSNAIAKARKDIQSLLDYDLAIAMDMLSSGDVPPDRVLHHVKNVAIKLATIKQFEG
tara:strand:- start:425 stop:649 length:225 start_codon:yes stop_codon:yes gene_type:complete